MESRLIGRLSPCVQPGHSGYTGAGENCCLSVSAAPRSIRREKPFLSVNEYRTFMYWWNTGKYNCQVDTILPQSTVTELCMLNMLL